jgi:flavorubredoxin
MKDVFKAAKVTEDVYWVGAIDFSVRDFHGYLTSRGTTYNAYLILADKVTLIDTVKAPFKDEMLARVASVVDPEKVEYVISNHSEPDHSGALVQTIAAVKPEKVFASVKGVEALRAHYHLDGGIVPVKDGGTLSLGDRTVTFLETRMLHWPDSMFSYLQEEKLLFSQDGFGMHLASYERFDDELDAQLLEYEAAKYYANILLPLSNFVTKTLHRVTELGLELEIIAPDHGPIWRKDVQKIIDLYARWARQERNNKAIVVYDTMWSSTELMARAIGEGLRAGGASPKLMPMSGYHRSDVATEILDAGALIAGSPTINNTMFPTMADVLTYIKGLRPKNLIGAAFGSYGWGGEAGKDIRTVLEQMKVELVDEPLRIVYVPGENDLKRCYELGLKVAERLTEKAAQPVRG